MNTRSSAGHSRRLWRLVVPGAALAALALSGASLATAASAATSAGSAHAAGKHPASASGFNQPGDILISDQFNDQVIEINMAKQIVFAQGMIQVDGSGFNQLNAPYDAKVVGDYTGLTPPFGFGH